ncbi:hypothetical protein [Nonomuraea sp. NPDC049725]|uniref:hypothetical protein n=1 Tax=Nonomuraea sp. NPDC049725 TaxID=3154508 RepID=UPI003434A31E
MSKKAPISRRVLRVIAAGVSVCALVGVVRLTVPATAGTSPGPGVGSAAGSGVGSPVGAGEPGGVRRQLAFLRSALDAGAGDEAQQLFPEGFFFLHALYGLAWVELGMREPAGERSDALREARWALARLDSPAGREPFSPDLVPSYGVFYRGWTNWLRGGVLALQPAAVRDAGEVRRFADDSAALGAAFDASLAASRAASGSPYLAAYPGQAWPVDSTVAVASLRLHDALLPPRYGGTAERWLRAVRQRLDPRTGLLPHRAAVAEGSAGLPGAGEPVEGARGSSQSVIQRFLVEVDPGFAREQYVRFRERFVVSPLGLGPATREYPVGLDGPGDVDSGPLPLGVSLSASVVTLGAAQVQGDAALAGALADYGELVGLPVGTPWTKRYAFGLMPIGDAFLAWSKTALPWVTPPPSPPEATVSPWWPAPLLALLLAIGAAPWLPAVIRRRRAARAVRAVRE